MTSVLPLARLPHLQMLVLVDSKVPAANVAELRKRRPDIEVVTLHR